MTRAVRVAALLALVAACWRPQAASAQQPSLHELGLGAGIPIPLRVYGGPASLDDAGLDLLLVLHLRATYSARPFERIEPLRVGARSTLSLVGVTDGELSLWGWAAMLGPHAGALLPLRLVWPSALAVGAGPALARSGFRIDEHLWRAFWAPAFFAFTDLAAFVAPSIRVGIELALEHVLAAPDDQAFFNRRLGATTLLTVSLGLTLGL